MDLADASVFFDDDAVYDGYTGFPLFKAQVSSFDDSQSDGATNRRRILSVGPAVVMPARRCITLYGDAWVVGTGTPDGWQGDIIRQHFTMKRVTDYVTLLTANQLLTGAVGTKVAVHKFFFREDNNLISTSETDNFWNIFVSPTEPATKGWFFKAADGRIYRVRNDYLPVEGLRVCQSDELEISALVSVQWSTGTLDPINDTVSGGTTVVNALAFETPKFYRFRYATDPIATKGDLTVFIPATITPKQGDMFTMGGKRWRAVTVQSEADAWAVYARLA